MFVREYMRDRNVFPALAGMNRLLGRLRSAPSRVPRARGDEPAGAMNKTEEA